MILQNLNEQLWTLLFLPLFLLCAVTAAANLRPGTFRASGAAGASRDLGGTLDSAQAASTALAATVGTGNIVGTAQAIAMGGPGAVFWLWVAAALGCAVKYAEIYFGMEGAGGATAYIQRALGRRAASVYALLAALSALLVGNMAQMSSTVSAICGDCPRQGLWLRGALGLLFLLLLYLQTRGGIKRVGRVCAALVPFMSACYVLALSAVLLRFRAAIGPVLEQILHLALHPRAAIGAAGGAALRQTMIWGLRRGAFSNEAGLGTAANIHSGVKSACRGRHALWGPVEVFADTLVLCTLTALTILCSRVPIPYGTLPGPELLGAALARVFGKGAAGLFLAASLVLFGWSTVLGCFVSGGVCALWLGGGKGERLYRTLCCLGVLLGSVLPVELIWQTADTLNALMAAPNLLALLFLAPELRGERDAKCAGKA